jgi:hypothetical protein
MSIFRPFLLRSSALAVCAWSLATVSTAALAQEAGIAPAADNIADEPAPAPADDEPTSDIVVTAHRRAEAGALRTVSAGEYELSKADWSDVLSGTSALAMVKNLPGVTFTSTDAFGLDLSDGFLLVRGFRQQELAITFEGIPLNDGSYGSVTGTAPLNIGVTGTIGTVAVGPGSAAVSTFSNTATGGEMRYSLIEPKHDAEITISQGFGSNATYVTSLIAHSGDIGDGGPRLLLGVERIAKDKYTGAGTQNMLRANAKLVQDVPWGDVSAFVSFARAHIWGYNNTSFDMLDKLGWNGTDILYPDYAHAVYVASPANADLPCGAYTCGELATLLPYDTGQATDDLVGNLTHRFYVSDSLSGSVMAYGAISRSDIEISDIATPSPTGAPFSSLVWQTRPRRFGGTAELRYEIDAHKLSAGMWFEHGTATSRFASFSQPLVGQGAPLRPIGPYDRYGPAFAITNDARWTTQSLQFYVQDVFKPTDTLTLTAAVKAARFVTDGGGIGDDFAPNGRLVASDAFLPHLSIDWRPNRRNAIYLDVAKTMTGYRVSSRGNIGPVSSAWAADSQALFDAALPTLKPETDWNITLGGFHSFGMIDLSLDAYYGIISNRLFNGSSGPQYAPVRSIGIVPRSTLIGADAIVTLRPASWLNLSQSVSVSKLRYNDDLMADGEVIPLKGHYQPGYPGVSLITQASVKHGQFDAGLTSTLYLDDPFTYTNDIKVPTYWQVNARIGWHLPRQGRMPDLTVRLDANNLLNRNNIGSVGIGGYSVSGDYQTFMRSAPRQFVLTLSTTI